MTSEAKPATPISVALVDSTTSSNTRTAGVENSSISKKRKKSKLATDGEVHSERKKSSDNKSSSSSSSPSSQQNQRLPSAVEFEPPVACVRRILKRALPSSTNVGKDACAAFARACGIFIIYITACSHDFARENKRQTITANDVLAAVKELDFDEFTAAMQKFLETYRVGERNKKSARAAAALVSEKEEEGGDGSAREISAHNTKGDDDPDDEDDEEDVDDEDEEEEITGKEDIEEDEVDDDDFVAVAATADGDDVDAEEAIVADAVDDDDGDEGSHQKRPKLNSTYNMS